LHGSSFGNGGYILSGSDFDDGSGIRDFMVHKSIFNEESFEAICEICQSLTQVAIIVRIPKANGKGHQQKSQHVCWDCLPEREKEDDTQN
jgi:hypothetical protein